MKIYMVCRITQGDHKLIKVQNARYKQQKRNSCTLQKYYTNMLQQLLCMDVHKVHRHNANDNTVNNYSKLNNALHLL